MSEGIESNLGEVETAADDIGFKLEEPMDYAVDTSYLDGQYIVQGVANGISDETNNGVTLGASLKNLCEKIVTKFNSLFTIGSPSKLMAKQAGWIPAGVGVGIEDNTYYATDAMADMCQALTSEFDDTEFDMSDIIKMSEFTNNLSSVESQTDSFVSNMSEKLSNIQSDLLISPSFKESEMKAVTASQSTNSGLTTGLSNIYAKLGQNTNTNRNMKVSVYLDASNKLGDFVIDTINGNVVKTGNF
jgi:hypothetical protein